MVDEPAIDFAGLTALVKGCRMSKKINLRDAAEQCGVSASTLSRVERGDARPDFETVHRLVRWAGVPIERVLLRASNPSATKSKDAGRRRQPDTMETMEIQFRADPKLSPRAAESLITIMRAAYENAVESAQKK